MMDAMNRFVKGGLSVCAIGALFLTASVSYANLLDNSGFEDPLTSDGPPFDDNWEAFTGGAGAISINSTTNPLSGTQHLQLQISGTANNFAGVFQDVPGLSAGEELTWSGWSLDAGTDAGGTEIRIEWRDSVGNAEISRTANYVPVLTDVYTQWSLTDTVPAGADLARVVYAIQSFGAGPNQNIYVDDVSVTVIPEPASLALLGLGGLVMFLRRRAH
jgi:hypothetical protein